MRITVLIVALLVCISIVWASQGTDQTMTEAQRSAIEKAVLETNVRMTQASSSLDADKFFAYILDSDKGPIIQDGRLFKTRAEALEVVKAGFQAVSKMDRRYDQTYVTVISPQVALLCATGSSTATLPDGRTLSSPFAVSLVFVLRDGQWKVLHGHYSIPNQQ